MSQHSFSEIVKKVGPYTMQDVEESCFGDSDDAVFDDILDKRGETSICQWMNDAMIGWDDGLQTYYIQGPITRIHEDAEDVGGSDMPTWWFGRRGREIHNPLMMQAILSLVFDKPIELNDDIVRTLLEEREHGINNIYEDNQSEKQRVMSLFKEADRQWATLSSKDIRDEYIDGAYVEVACNLIPGTRLVKPSSDTADS